MAARSSRVELILYVADQSRSGEFYRSVLGSEPTLDVPGMTEFELGGGRAVLGLMPVRGIARLLGAELFEGSEGAPPRCELYLHVDDPAAYHGRAIAAGARELAPPSARDWGDIVAYSLDPDGHVLAFATPDPQRA